MAETKKKQNESDLVNGGVSLRAYIATRAMQGLLANSWEGDRGGRALSTASADEISGMAVAQADSLIKHLAN